MKLEGWVAYNDKKEKTRCNIPEAGERDHPASVFVGTNNIVLDEDHGVFQYSVVGDRLYLTGIVGNLAALEPMYMDIAKMNGCTKIIGYSCTKKPKTVARVFKAKLTRTWYEYEREVT